MDVGPIDGAPDCLVLLDQFEHIHQRKSHVVPSDVFSKLSADAVADADIPTDFLYATTHNSKRREFIDHVWASTVEGGGGLVPLQVSNTRMGWQCIPHEEEPSDHIPIGVLFEFQYGEGKEEEADVSKADPNKPKL